jgi:hypothetical protein
MTAEPPERGFLLYQTEDAPARIQVRFAANGLWLTQQQLADLNQSTLQNMTQHKQIEKSRKPARLPTQTKGSDA